MGLSTRILLGICLPTLALLLAVGAILHQALAAREIGQRQRQLEHAALCATQQLGAAIDLLGERMLTALAHPPLTREFEAGARQLIASQPSLRAVEIHAPDGTPVAAFGNDSLAERSRTLLPGRLPTPAPAEDFWRVPAVRDGSALAWQLPNAAQSAPRLLRLVRRLPGEPGLLASVLLSDRSLAMPALLAGTSGLLPVTLTVETPDGAVPIRLGPPLVADDALSASALLPLHAGRLVVSQSRAFAIAGLVELERGALLAVALLVAALAVQLRGGLGRDVLRPVHALTEVVQAFEAGRPTPPRRRDAARSSELAALETGLRRAVDGFADSQQRLRELNASLEQRVAERTSELVRANTELRLARDEARVTASSRMAFVAYMSHELRTPLNAIVGLSGLLLDSPLDDEQRDNAETVRNASQTLLGVLNTVLDLSRAEAGHLPVEAVDFTLEELVDEVGDLLAGTAHRAGLELLTEIDPACPARLCGDPNLLRQVLVNFTANAIKFTEHGQVVLHVRLDGGAAPTPAAPPGGTNAAHVLRFEVQDTGIGLSPEAQSRLFQPYVQAEETTARRYGGTGLGLAISKQIVARLGGRIGVVSSPAGGSTFWCTVPLGRAAAAAEEAPGAGAPAQRWELHGVRALLAVPLRTALELRERRLAALGLRVESVADGAAALARAREAFASGAPFGVIVLDDTLLEPSAVEVCAGLRGDPATARTPIVLLVRQGSLGHSQRQAALAAGVGAILQKPLRQRPLAETLVLALNGGTPALLVPETPPAPGARDPAAPRAAAPARWAGDPHLLVAEDSAMNRKVMLRVLEKLGYRVDLVADGAAAIEACARTRYAAVLMDCQLPEVDGCGATEAIRRAEREAGLPRVPILAMTAAGMPGDRERALAAGMDDYLVKPVLREHLAERLRAAIGRAGAAVPAPRA